MRLNPNTQEAYKLFASGSLCLSRMEQRGIRIDPNYLKRTSEVMAMNILEMQTKLLRRTDEGKALTRRYGDNANLNSPAQISKVFFDDMGYKLPDDKRSTDDAALVRIGTDFCKQLGEYRSLVKAKGTYIDSILKQAVQRGEDWFIHPTFSLMLVSTYRSSSFDPNLQNIPIRDPEIGKLVRSAFYPRRGNHLMEIDYSGAEVSASVCYHQDPNMLAYLQDPSSNMHRDTASDCFICSGDEVSKEMRQATKTFVFGEFYGDWYKPQARILWEAMIRDDFKLTTGVSAKKHLRQHGIKNLSQFTTHMQEVERIMWEDRFGVYGKWKDDTWAEYCRKGYYHTLTGFTLQGIVDKKQLCNSPIQGSAFHWLLWSVTQGDRWTIKNNLKSYPVGQIHDSMIWDVHPNEVDYVAEKMVQIMTSDIYEMYPWINTQLQADIDLSPVDCSWHEKKAQTKYARFYDGRK